eukprot:scaffold124246_cov35-Tisochrysis_lutea.AAC.5
MGEVERWLVLCVCVSVSGGGLDAHCCSSFSFCILQGRAWSLELVVAVMQCRSPASRADAHAGLRALGWPRRRRVGTLAIAACPWAHRPHWQP